MIWLGLMLTMLAPTGATAQQNLSFKDFDKDGDGKIERAEFHEVFILNYWDDWDNTDNAGLDDEDFYTFTYTVLDTDNDNRLSADEWGYGLNNYYGQYIRDDYMAYDVNHDNYISAEEYTGSVYDTGYFGQWDVDRDGYLSEDELADKVFDTWDTNNNRLMNRSEFANFDFHYADI